MRYESSGYAEYFGVERNQNKLEHHGIKGQKWGKRNGPPYPLDPEDHSAAEKKATNKSWGIKKSEGSSTSNNTSRKSSRFASSLTSDSKSLTSADNKFVDKVRNGERLSDAERAELKKSHDRHYDDNRKLDNDHVNLLKKNMTRGVIITNSRKMLNEN